MGRPAAFLGIALTLAAAGSLAGAQSQCGGTFAVGTIFTKTDFPNPLPNGQTCKWTLLCSSTEQVGLLFANFDIGPNCYLDIYNGTTVGAAETRLTTYTGLGPGPATVLVAGPVTLQLRCLAVQEIREFRISFSKYDPPQRGYNKGRSSDCGGQATGAGTITSPGYPGWYPTNKYCTWTLTACEVGAMIQIEFSAFDVEANYDWLLINYTKPGKEGSLRYMGKTLPPVFSGASPVKVVLDSDNIYGKNSGFSFKFFTVPTDVASLDPMASPAVCPALCPATVQPDPTSYCYAHDDPHLKTFCDGGAYEFQYEGVYYMYKHMTAPISVQVVFQDCYAPESSPVTCSCAVAIRYCNEIFVVDRCFHVGKTDRDNKVYKAGTGNQMSITVNGGSFKVLLPTGLTVDIGSGWRVIGIVDIRDSLGNKNMAGGLCDCQRGYKCGTNATDYRTAGESWRVGPEESLFREWKPKYPCKIASCATCKLQSYVLPKGVADATTFTSNQYSDGTTFSFKKKTKRALADENPVPLEFKAPWTRALAEQHCRSSIAGHAGINACQQTLGGNLDLTNSINDCMTDILYTGGATFTSTALEGSKLNCLNTLNHNGLSDAAVLRLMCPNECSSKGTCSNGVCTCNAGWFGVDCTVDLSVPPILQSSSIAPNCTQDAAPSESCLLQYVDGQTFHDVIAGFPKCRIQSQVESVNNDSAVVTAIVSAEQVSPSRAACRLPAGKQGDTVRYVISISNDGVAYSNGLATSRSFKPSRKLNCGPRPTTPSPDIRQRLSNSGTLNSPGYPSSYPNDANSSWTLTAAAGKVVQLHFNSFDVENNFDFVRIYDDGRLVDTFTGNLGAQPERPYGKSVTVVFNSDSAETASGFSIAFTSVDPIVSCGGALAQNAIISSPLQPGLYPPNVYCLWTLTPTEGLIANLHFTAFNLDAGGDYLRVYAAGALVAEFSGPEIPEDTTIDGQSPYLVFRSDGAIQYDGFNLEFTSTELPSFE